MSFRANYVLLKKSDIEILFMDYHNTFKEKDKKIGGHNTKYLSAGPNLTHTHRFRA